MKKIFKRCKRNVKEFIEQIEPSQLFKETYDERVLNLNNMRELKNEN